MYQLGICPRKALAQVSMSNPKGLICQPQALTCCISLQGCLDHVQVLGWVMIHGRGGGGGGGSGKVGGGGGVDHLHVLG